MSLRNLWKICEKGGVLLCSLAALSSPCFARTPPVKPRPASEKPRPLSPANDLTAPNPLALLYRPDVQAEIALTPAQRQQLQTRWLARLTRHSTVSLNALKQMTARQRSKQLLQERAQMNDIREGVQGDLDAALLALLHDDQTRRLRELDLQQRGPFAFAEPKIADALELSLVQRRRAAAFITDYRAARQRQQQASDALMAPPLLEEPDTRRPMPPPPDIEEKMARIRQASAEADEAEKTARPALLRLLTPEQIPRWKALLGKPFVFAPPTPGGTDNPAAPIAPEKG